jgi:hypothetical protein
MLFVQIDCAACHQVAPLTPECLRRLGLSPRAKVLDLDWRVRRRGRGARGWAIVSIKGGARAGEPLVLAPASATRPVRPSPSAFLAAGS